MSTEGPNRRAQGATGPPDEQETARRATERIEAHRQAGLHPTLLGRAIDWARAEVQRPQPFIGACCGLAMAGLEGDRHGLVRQGLAPPVVEAERADLLLVMGSIGLRQVHRLRDLYARMPEPRRVMAVGACACSGGLYDNYATLGPVDALIPVDIYIPGCPPSPEAVLDGLRELQRVLRDGAAGAAGAAGA